MKRIVVFIILISFLCCFLGGVIYFKSKGENNTGMFEKNSSSISIYHQNTLLCELIGKEKDELINHLKKINLTEYKEIPINHTFEYKIDCNNNWGVIYFSSQSKNFYLNKDNTKQFTFSDDSYSYIFDTIIVQD